MTTENAGLPVADTRSEVRYFTVDSANRTLVLVRRVVGDIVRTYRELMELRARRDGLSVSDSGSAELERIQERVGEQVEALNNLERELREIGCQLKDWAVGLVDFPARYENRTVLLCWRLGEERVEHWHELHAGFKGRRLVGPDFD